MFFNQKTKQSIISAPQWLLHQFLSITKRERESRGKTQTLTQTLILASSTKPNKTREGKRAKEKKTKKSHKRELFTHFVREIQLHLVSISLSCMYLQMQPLLGTQSKASIHRFYKPRERFSQEDYSEDFKNCLDIQSTLHQLQISSAQGCMLRYLRMYET
jgi:hypothetical protein